MKSVLNVGGNSRTIPLPPIFDGWRHVLLDIDPSAGPDIVCDARELVTLPPGAYDAVYCSHNLEHYHHHDVPRVLAGILHVLRDDGFVEIRVPDIGQVMRLCTEKNLDIADVLYQAPAGPVTVRDVIYGFGREIERSGRDFFAHKTGFTSKSLRHMLAKSRFAESYVACANLEIFAFAFKRPAGDDALSAIGLERGNAKVGTQQVRRWRAH